MTPVLSIVVPCYNAETTIERALDSLLGQETDHAYEIVCVNDGSTDRTLEILEEYGLSNSIINIVDSCNRGAWIARLLGIKASVGKFIAFLDSDDTATPDYVERFVRHIHDNVDIVVAGYRRVDENDRVLSEEFCTPRKPIYIENETKRLLEVNPAPWNKAYRSTVLKGIGDLETHPIMFDDLCLFLLAVSKMEGCIVFLDHPLVDYRVRSDSSIASANLTQVKTGAVALHQVRSCVPHSIDISNWNLLIDTVAGIHLGISMLLRLAQNKDRLLYPSYEWIRSYLDCNFPYWNSSKLLSASSLFSRNAFYRKALLGRYAFCTGRPFVRLLSLITNSRHFKITW